MNRWLSEPIPDDAILFYRVPVGWLKPGNKLHPGVFRENKGSMSTDWSKYSTGAETRARTGKPLSYAVLRLVVSGVTEIGSRNVIETLSFSVQGYRFTILYAGYVSRPTVSTKYFAGTVPILRQPCITPEAAKITSPGPTRCRVPSLLNSIVPSRISINSECRCLWSG